MEKKDDLTIKDILREGKFPAIVVEEKIGEIGTTTTITFRLDKVNAVTLSINTKTNKSEIIVQMDGSEKITFRFETLQEAEKLHTYIMNRW